MKVLLIFGTRPEAIKMAPIIKAMKKKSDQYDTIVCVTAQHREMLDHVMELFVIKADYDLNIMQRNQSLSGLTSKLFHSLDRVVAKENPEWILVQGDTTSAMVGSMVGYYHRVKIGHVEAGLRTFDKFHPFPEEINRKITSNVADLHFAPTVWAKNNLTNEGIQNRRIFVTGNTVIDALKYAVNKYPCSNNAILRNIPDGKKIILVTAHRRENFGKSLHQICEALCMVAAKYGDEVHIIYPVHPNPNIRKTVEARLGNIQNICLVKPLKYLSFVHIMQQAYLILTDSGGLQEEAPTFGKPVLVLRQTTERPEAVETGTAKVVGVSKNNIFQAVCELLENQVAYNKMAAAKNPFGDGQAALRICDALQNESMEKVALAC
jgi:UDP-N-acetylglucosamine 2-epimerase (non-hydrolysing)